MHTHMDTQVADEKKYEESKHYTCEDAEGSSVDSVEGIENDEVKNKAKGKPSSQF